MSKYRLRRILREKIRNEALVYLNNQKMKQEKIKQIEYNELKMQNYLVESDRNISVSKVIYKRKRNGNMRIIFVLGVRKMSNLERKC